LKKKYKILILSGDLLKHKYVAIKLLRAFKGSNVIFEKYPKNINKNYSKDKSKEIINHFKKVEFYEKKFFYKFCNKNKNYLKKRTLFEIKKGNINTAKVFNKIKKNNPNLIILNATSIIKKNFISQFKNKIINIHSGLIPYYRGAGCNVWTFYNKELEYTGVSIHFVNEKIDDGKILLQSQTKFQKNDNTHSVGCRNAKLSVKLSTEVIKYLSKNPNYKGKKIFTKKNSIFYKRDFKKGVILQINKLLKSGLVKKYYLNQKKIKLVKLKK
jgi:phosphoribosylglycinamide formyltransferase 1